MVPRCANRDRKAPLGTTGSGTPDQGGHPRDGGELSLQPHPAKRGRRRWTRTSKYPVPNRDDCPFSYDSDKTRRPRPPRWRHPLSRRDALCCWCVEVGSSHRAPRLQRGACTISAIDTFVVPQAGLEPARLSAPGSEPGASSIPPSGHENLKTVRHHNLETGWAGGTRTHDLLLKRKLL